MPPTTVHFNGSVNLPDAETVMREISSRIPNGRAPDDRRGDRRPQLLDQLPDREVRADAGVRDRCGRPGLRDRRRRAGMPQLRLAEGLGRDDRLARSRLRRRVRQVVCDFRAHAERGTIPADVRFQLQYPTPLASVGGYVRARGPSGSRRLTSRRCSPISTRPSSVSATIGRVQWDVAVEFGAWRERWGRAADRRDPPGLAPLYRPRPRRRAGRHAPLLRRLRPPALHAARSLRCRSTSSTP